jgi:glutamine synthetase
VQREQIVFVGTSDLSGHFRGKSFPAADLQARLERGVGICPSNLFLSAFGPIQWTPFGTVGEVFLLPDPGTRVCIAFDSGATEYFFVGDFKIADGSAWSFCPRQVLRRALERLETETGWRLLAAFEQEFVYSGVPAHPVQPYALDGYRRQGVFGETLLATLRQAGVVPDSFLCEYGARQYEVTVAPAVGLRAADDAVITRELTKAVAFHCGHEVSFTPLPEIDGTSNGTHIHWSFLDVQDRPVLYDAGRPQQLSALGTHFVAGVLDHLPAICAITAPSPPSYYRMRPNRFAPQRTDLGVLDRAAAVRICPVAGTEEAKARQYNLEFRVADATASPYLALAMLVQAGLDGVRRRLELDAVESRALPDSLAEALTLLEGSAAATGWLGSELHAAYLSFKRAELGAVRDSSEADICRRYAEVY